MLCEVLCECLSSGLEGVVELLLEPLMVVGAWIKEERWFLVGAVVPLLLMCSPLAEQPQLRHVCQ